MKKLAPAAAALLLALWGTACGAPAAPAPSPESAPILYSNLTDPASQEEVAAALQSHGISQERTDTLLAWADDFNTRVTKPALPEGFVPMEGLMWITAVSSSTIRNFRTAPSSRKPTAA